MKIRVSKLAQREIDDAFDWYDTQSSGLGLKFLDDFDRSVRRISSYPHSCEEITDKFTGACFPDSLSELSTALIRIQLS